MKRRILKKLKPGARETLTRPVEFHRTIKYFQDHLPAVLSTPSMIGQMEVTAGTLMRRYQPEEFLSLGTHINVSHRAAARVGEKLRTVAVFKRAYEPDHGGSTRYVFEVEAWVGKRLIGRGEVERAAIPRPPNAYKRTHPPKNKRTGMVVPNF